MRVIEDILCKQLRPFHLPGKVGLAHGYVLFSRSREILFFMLYGIEENTNITICFSSWPISSPGKMQPTCYPFILGTCQLEIVWQRK